MIDILHPADSLVCYIVTVAEAYLLLVYGEFLDLITDIPDTHKELRQVLSEQRLAACEGYTVQ